LHLKLEFSAKKSIFDEECQNFAVTLTREP